MIFDAATFKSDVRLETDLVVVGSGAGGMAAAMAAAEKGVRTLILEQGEYLTPADMTQREEQMLPRLLQESGARASEDGQVKVHQGKGVGGSTLHNLNVCKRIPEAILSAWNREFGLKHLPPTRWAELYDEVEALLGVSPIPRESWNRHNRLLEAGCSALGWRGGGLSHNRRGCFGSGFCELGCAYDAKNNAAKILLPRALAAGAEIVTNCTAIRIEHAHGAVTGIEAVAVEPRGHRKVSRVTVHAKRVCVAASATGSAALLTRSNVADPSVRTGQNLHIHPAVVVAGDFDEPVHAWQGIPQAYECTEFLQFDGGEHRSWVLPAFAHPMGTATMVPGHGAAHRAFMDRYAHLAVLTALVHDLTRGVVRPRGEFGLTIDYWPTEADRSELSFGLWVSAKLLFAAGARRVLIPTRLSKTLALGDDLEPLKRMPIEAGALDIVGVHPMSTVPMADDPRRAPVGSDGKHHHMDGLWVADGSLFPTSIGVPPQLSIYALGLHVGRWLAVC